MACNCKRAKKFEEKYGVKQKESIINKIGRYIFRGILFIFVVILAVILVPYIVFKSVYSLFFGDIDDKMSMMFDILDFDGDGSIIYDDAFLILSHLHLIDYHDNKINYLEILISHFFGSKTKIEKENLFDLNENYDVLLLLLMFLNKHQSLISEEELSFYETSTKKTKNKNSDLTLNYLYTYSIQHNNSIIN